MKTTTAVADDKKDAEEDNKAAKQAKEDKKVKQAKEDKKEKEVKKEEPKKELTPEEKAKIAEEERIKRKEKHTVDHSIVNHILRKQKQNQNQNLQSIILFLHALNYSRNTV